MYLTMESVEFFGMGVGWMCLVLIDSLAFDLTDCSRDHYVPKWLRRKKACDNYGNVKVLRNHLIAYLKLIIIKIIHRQL